MSSLLLCYKLCPGECCTSSLDCVHACQHINISVPMGPTVISLPRRLLRIMSGETGLSFLSALMSSSSRSWRLRGRGGWGFSLRAATWQDSHTSEHLTVITMETKEGERACACVRATLCSPSFTPSPLRSTVNARVFIKTKYCFHNLVQYGWQSCQSFPRCCQTEILLWRKCMRYQYCILHRLKL